MLACIVAGRFGDHHNGMVANMFGRYVFASPGGTRGGSTHVCSLTCPLPILSVRWEHRADWGGGLSLSVDVRRRWTRESSVVGGMCGPGTAVETVVPIVIIQFSSKKLYHKSNSYQDLIFSYSVLVGV